MSPHKPLVSITIPTRNSARTLDECLRCSLQQDYPNLEVVIIDSHSVDETRKIAESHGVRVLTTEWKLLGARYLGTVEAKGEYILLLDSDQLLERDCVSRAVAKVLSENLDMLCLEEFSNSKNTWIERLFEADRELVNSLQGIQLDPETGTLLPRFFKRSLLLQSFERIPHSLFPLVVAHDHAIIYHEASKLCKGIAVLETAVKHNEPSSLIELWMKNYNYGKTTRKLLKTGCYASLIRNKTRLRKGVSIDVILGIKSSVLLMLKAIPYGLGYLRGFA